MRLTRNKHACLAWESLSSDQTGWGNNIALCALSTVATQAPISDLGADKTRAIAYSTSASREDWFVCAYGPGNLP